ncbi:MAG: glucose-6-phosphate dehydrogenase [Acidimicrobiia bacterium]|nr:glucose-6-phosphate dehydrogenase [Acidimicrobiia bacterium]
MSLEGHTAPPAQKSGEPANPCVMVIFGAAGDLTKRKLIPALYNLAKEELLSENFAVVGIARREMAEQEFQERIGRDAREFATGGFDPKLWERLSSCLHYLCGHFDDDTLYGRLRELLLEVDSSLGTRSNYFYYLATAPEYFSPIVRKLHAAGLTQEQDGHWRRVIIEKPFGTNLDSARILNRDLASCLNESQIYRIDHYLGKETVQNILVFRFSNGIFEPIWNRRYIDHVQVTVAEDIGVEQRGGYYDTAGALRDMVPNHIFQLISLTAMEPPISFEADAVRDEQAKILRAIQPMTPEEVLTRTVRGQYGGGVVKGKPSVAYRSEVKVAPDSFTETFVALKVSIDNWRWSDVPFYLRTGKYMPRRVTEIAIQFKRAPFMLFRKTPIHRLTTNRLVIRLQPDEGIALRFGAKVPGPLMRLGPVDMDFKYAETFGSKPSTGYERLLYDCMTGDATLFQRADMVEAAWGVVAPILDVWKALPPRQFPNYPAGTWGPKEADDLLERDGRYWRSIEE